MPDVEPLRTDGLTALVGRTVCVVVYSNDIAVSGGSANLTGPTLGRVAFKVVCR